MKKKEKDCWRACDYPSQCRWGKSVGVHTPSPTPTRTVFPADVLGSCETAGDAVVLDTMVLEAASTLNASSTLDSSLLNSRIPDLPSLEECFATSPSSFYSPAISDSGYASECGSECAPIAHGRSVDISTSTNSSAVPPHLALEASTHQRKSAESLPPGLSARDIEMADAPGAPLLFTPATLSAAGSAQRTGDGAWCIDPALLVLPDTRAGAGASACVSVAVRG